MAVADLETKNVNFEVETKVDDQMEDCVLAKANIVENHRKLCNHKKKTVKKTIVDVKANGKLHRASSSGYKAVTAHPLG